MRHPIFALRVGVLPTVLLWSICFASVCALAQEDGTPPLRVTNYNGGETIDYPVALLYGTLADAGATEIVCENKSSQKASRIIKGSAFKGKFKVLAELVPGVNQLEIRSGDFYQALEIRYERNQNPTVVRIIYMTDSSGETLYQTPIENDAQNFREKLDAAMKIMQTFTAERMNDLGFGRNTFNIELDDKGDVIVHVFKGKRTAEEYYALPDQQWYRVVMEEIREEFPMDNARNLVIPAYTRFDPEQKRPLGHTALGGGGGLALFGSGDLFTWANNLNDVVRAFEDSTPIDSTQFFDDSVGRTCHWGAYSTTLGAALHEVGHTFFLPHSNMPHDIMTRGHDRINRVFIVREAPSQSNPNWYEFRDDEVACFVPMSAYALVRQRWFVDEEKTLEEMGELKVELNAKENKIECESPEGVFYARCFAGERAHWFYGAPLDGETPTKISFDIADILKDVPKELESWEFMVMNAKGATRYMGVKTINRK
ncbi:MAG: hypothetical protein Q4D38_12310 [Planctomycetia bacterium]|nr:hypothetical protein [Planctomycetia bacterium]